MQSVEGLNDVDDKSRGVCVFWKRGAYAKSSFTLMQKMEQKNYVNTKK